MAKKVPTRRGGRRKLRELENALAMSEHGRRGREARVNGNARGKNGGGCGGEDGHEAEERTTQKADDGGDLKSMFTACADTCIGEGMLIATAANATDN